MSPDMWRGMKQSLDTKLEDTHEVVHEHNKVRAQRASRLAGLQSSRPYLQCVSRARSPSTSGAVPGRGCAPC